MSEKHQSRSQKLGGAIRAHRATDDGRDLTSLNRTLVKSGLWKKLTLERIESTRNGDAEGPDREILQQLKAAMGDLVEQYWQDLVRSAAEKIVDSSDPGPADPANEDEVRHEITNARKLLAMHEATMRRARYRLYEERARVYVRNKRIDSLATALGTMRSTHAQELDRQRTRYAKLHEAFEEFQHEADQLLLQLDSENLRLKASARKAAQ